MVYSPVSNPEAICTVELYGYHQCAVNDHIKCSSGLTLSHTPLIEFSPSKMALNVQPLVFDCPATDQGASLKLTVKRYSTAASGSDGLTLLFAHCIGGRKRKSLPEEHGSLTTRTLIDKEIWEPVIEGIFKIQGSKPKNHRIREAYSFDRQTHGDAAIINEEALKARTDGVSRYHNFKSANVITEAIDSGFRVGVFNRSVREVSQPARKTYSCHRAFCWCRNTVSPLPYILCNHLNCEGSAECAQRQHSQKTNLPMLPSCSPNQPWSLPSYIRRT